MVATAGVVKAGSFIGHDIDHWSVTGVNMQTAAVASAMVEIIEQKATIVELGTLGIASAATAFTTETPNGWGETAALAKAALETACDANTITAAAVFTAVTF
jgi:hypothetical protein